MTISPMEDRLKRYSKSGERTPNAVVVIKLTRAIKNNSATIGRIRA